MHSKRLAVPAVLAALAGLAAQNAPPPVPLELRARFGFQGPLITKVGDGIGGLQAGDIDGDGRLELVVLDPRRARLVVLRVQGKEVAQEIIPTGGQVSGYTLADVDGDGRQELLVVDARGRLSIDRPGRDAGPRSFDLGLGGRGVVLRPGDLDGDGRQDLVAFGRGELRVVTGLSGTPALSPIEPVEENMHSAHVTDVDGDGRLDLVAVAPGERMNLRLRLGHGDGTFGPWRIATVDGLSDVFPAKLADGGNALATIEGPNRRVALHRYAAYGDQAGLEWWSFGDAGATRTPAFVVGDVDGDGDEDLVVFPRERAQMLVYEWRDGTFFRRAVPSLAGVESVALGDVDKDGTLDLVLASPEEDAVAWCPGNQPIGRFPEQLPCVDKPVAVAVDPKGGVLVLARDKRRDAHLHRTAPLAEPARLADLGRLAADPARLVVADVGDRDGLEVAFVVPGEGLRAVTLGGDDKPGDDVAGFTRRMDDGALMLCEHDGKPTLVVVRERFVRCFRFDQKGQVDVLVQDNGPDGAQELTLACELGGGSWLYYDKKSEKLLRTSTAAPTATTEVPQLGVTHLVRHQGAALLLGPRGVMRASFDAGPSLRAASTHEPPTDRTYYWHGESGDFDGDGVVDLVVVDRRLPGVQVIAGGEKGLARALAVPMFETPPSEGPDSEPRELVTGDLDGDGRCDFAVVAHDRVLIYPQDK